MRICSPHHPLFRRRSLLDGFDFFVGIRIGFAPRTRGLLALVAHMAAQLIIAPRRKRVGTRTVAIFLIGIFAFFIGFCIRCSKLPKGAFELTSCSEKFFSNALVLTRRVRLNFSDLHYFQRPKRKTSRFFQFSEPFALSIKNLRYFWLNAQSKKCSAKNGHCLWAKSRSITGWISPPFSSTLWEPYQSTIV